MSGWDDGFLHRWSRRKENARAAAGAVSDAAKTGEAKTPVAGAEQRLGPSPSDPLQAAAEAARSDEACDETTLAERLAELPRIEDIDEFTDVTRFLQPWVPESLRREALRKLWTVDRAVRDHVIYADYALDYNTPGAAPGYGPIETTADMISRALGSFSRDPLQPPKAAASESGERSRDRKEPGALSGDEAADGAPDQGALDFQPIGGRPDAASGAGSTSAASAAADLAASREELVLAAPLPGARRRHGSAAPRVRAQ